MARRINQLPQVAFSILLALSLKPRHGYEIMQQVSEDSNNKIRLVPGALYTSIKLLHEQGMVQEVANSNDTRRRYYELTGKGRKTLNAELSYYDNSVRLAKQRNIYGIMGLTV